MSSDFLLCFPYPQFICPYSRFSPLFGSNVFLASKVAAPMNILYLYLCLYFVLSRDFLHSVFLASWVAAAMNILTGLSFNAWWENRPCVFYDNLYIFFTNISSQPLCNAQLDQVFNISTDSEKHSFHRRRNLKMVCPGKPVNWP